MRVSLHWLRRHADLPDDVAEMAHRLSMAGYVVASVEQVTLAAGPDTVLDVEVTWNRPDLLSHVGLAREIAGLYGLPLRSPEVSVGASVPDTVPVTVEAGDLCPVYTARVVRGVRVGPSPAWLASLLEAAGQRPVNNVVDVTNWVMLETGQPLHAFDLARLKGPSIVVRRGRGESFTAIDGRKLEVAADDLAICDAGGPVALAGVMGGLDSEVSSTTTDIVLESAVFAPLSVRATSRRHQLRSESSHRFERFVDPAGVVGASDLAAQLFAEVCGATGVGPVTQSGPGAAAHAARIELRTDRVARVLGVAVGESEISDILLSLGLRSCEPVAAGQAGTTAWSAPTWRPDLREEIDLIEEVGRRIGFDRIPDRTVLGVRPRVVDPALEVRRRVRAVLVRQGLRECISAPFVGDGPLDVALLTDRPSLRVMNPMRADEDRLRRSLVGPLLATVRRNQERGTPAVRLFETAPVYVAGDAPGTADERLLAAGAVSGDYADAKGCVEAVLAALGMERVAEYSAGAPRPLRPDRSATIRLPGCDHASGVIGELSPRTAQRYGLTGPTAVFELRLDDLAAAARLESSYEPISRYPAIQRDLAWVVSDAVPWSRIEAAAWSAGAPLVQAVSFLSEFRSEQVGAGQKSVAFRMELRAADRTLTSDEAETCVRGVVDRLASETGGVLRG